MQGRPLVHAFAIALVLDLVLDVPARGAEAVRPAHGSPTTVWAVEPDSLVAFRLSDQFGRVQDAADLRGRAYLLVGAGRGGRTAGTAWVESLRALQGDSVGPAVLPVVAVADLRGVPRLLRRVVRGRFPDVRDRGVLLDWEGTLARQLGFDVQQCTIVLVGPTGRVHARTTTTVVDLDGARAILRQAQALSSTAMLAPGRVTSLRPSRTGVSWDSRSAYSASGRARRGREQF
jgi:hypothetical protein